MHPLKVHLRIVDVDGYTYRVLSLRPSMGVRFSTNRFHETWHILTCEAGAKVLGRLLWGLSFQRAPGTLVVIDEPHLVTTPFDGDPADMIVIAPRATSTDAKRLRLLREALRRHPRPSGTVRLLTFGLDEELARWAELGPKGRSREWWELSSYAHHDLVDRRGGVICYSAHPASLRIEALALTEMAPGRWGNYHYLDWRSEERHPNGEVQVFTNFADRVSAGKVTRRALLGDAAGLISDEQDRWTVQAAVEREQHARVEARVSRARARRGYLNRMQRPPE